MSVRQIFYTRSCRRSISRLAKKDRSVAATVEQELERLAGRRKPPRDQIPGLGGRPVYKTRFRIGNRPQGRLIVLVDDERVVGIVVYSKSRQKNMTPGEIERLLEGLDDAVSEEE